MPAQIFRSGPVRLLLLRAVAFLAGLLPAAGAGGAWTDPEVWAGTRQRLDELEHSSQLEQARAEYLELLAAIGADLERAVVPLEQESQLREYYRRALSLARLPQEEGALLSYLAGSFLRSVQAVPENRRRAESLLQQAAAVLPGAAPLDAVHYQLGELYASLGRDGTAPLPGEAGSFHAQAVFHLRALLGMEGARPHYREAAETALQELLRPELELEVRHRFLPGNEVRVRLRSRNVTGIALKVVALDTGDAGESAGLARLQAAWLEAEPVGEEALLDQLITIQPDSIHDWEETLVRLGENFAGGWYGVETSAGGVTRREVLLVSGVEVLAAPHHAGSVIVWVVETETGKPVPAADLYLLDDAGNPCATLATDKDGTAFIPAGIRDQWAEIHTQALGQPGLLRRIDMPAPRPILPWAITNAAEVMPGAAFDWFLIGVPGDGAAGYQNGLRLLFPGMLPQPAVARESGAGWLAGRATVPDNLSLSGPVYLDLPCGSQILITHVRHQKLLPIDIGFSGEQLGAASNLFLDSSPVRLTLSSASLLAGELPGFVRLRVVALERASGSLAGQPGIPLRETVVYERILAYSAEAGGTTVELPGLHHAGQLLPMRVEVLPLDDSVPIGEAHFALSPSRSLVALTIDHQLVHPGQEVRVSLDLKDLDDSPARPPEAQLVVYQERWESRYVHRKRGSPLSEAEFLALPERSMLGVARTDYRLAEQGFIRTEFSRRRVTVTRDDAPLPIKLEEPGYYLVAFEARDADVRALYPQGPLEVWVVPPSGDLRLFRSDKPRLLMEQQDNGDAELLVLFDRIGASVLLDLEFDDGTTLTRVVQSGQTAVYHQEPQQEGRGLLAVRAFVAGEQQSAFLVRYPEPETTPDWALAAPRQFGLNPGAPFAWPLVSGDGHMLEPVFWTFLQEDAFELAAKRLRWQEFWQQAKRSAVWEGGLFLDRWRPLPEAPGTSTLAAPAGGRTDPALVDGTGLLALFPELRRSPPALLPAFPVTVQAAAPEGGPVMLEGTLPNAAGRWYLTAVSHIGEPGNQLLDRAWLLSTDLPVLGILEGPASARADDRIVASLILENRTREPAALQVTLRTTGSIRLAAGRDLLSAVLLPGQQARLPIDLEAAGPGPGRLTARVEGAGSFSEATYTVSIAATPVPVAFRLFHVAPQAQPWQTKTALADWSDLTVLLASSRGWLLPELWAGWRATFENREPLAVALADWALSQTAQRHGIAAPGAPSQTAASVLNQMLERHKGAAGGWAWVPGQPSDPWLSALIVWTLETFSNRDGAAFALERERAYLESLLVNASLPLESRVLALRALASRTNGDAGLRPSRMQARAFLDFLHRRAEIGIAPLAMLLEVARAYRFPEEVKLLADELNRRIQPGSAGGGSFWQLSLALLALDHPEPRGNVPAPVLLQKALEALAREGPQRSWEQAGGLISLLAGFYWKGEFHVGGEVDVSFNDGPPQEIPLDPQVQGAGSHKWAKASLPAADDLQVELDTRSALSPVLLAFIGQPVVPPAIPALPGARVAWTRTYTEETLLAGSQRRVEELSGTRFALRQGDILQARYVIEAQPPWAHTELVFPVPAAALAPAAELEQVVRLASLSEGLHEFTFSHEILYPGEYVLPPARLLDPRTGLRLLIGEPLRLQVSARPE